MVVLAFFGVYFLIGYALAAWEIYRDNTGMGLFGLVLAPFWPVFLYIEISERISK